MSAPLCALLLVPFLASCVGYVGDAGDRPGSGRAETPPAPAHVATTLYHSCEALRVVGLLLAPFLPDTAPKILERLGLPDALATAKLPDDAARWGVLAPGTPTSKGAPLFPRIESDA